MDSSSKPVNLAFIGCGDVVQRRHLPALKRLRQVRVVALADNDPNQLKLVADRYGVARRHKDYRSLLDDNSIDAVAICSPPAEHFIQASAVLESGRHLFVETPVAQSAEDCDRLLELASRSTAVCTVGSSLRYHPWVERAERCIQDGLLGPIQAIAATFTTPSRGLRGDELPSWRTPESVDGTVFMEGVIQHFDLWRKLTGVGFEEISVQCSSVAGPVALSARLSGSIVAGAVFSEYAGDTNELSLIGRNGTLSLSLYHFNGFDYCPSLVARGSPKRHLKTLLQGIASLPHALRVSRRGGDYGDTFRLQWKAFVHSIREGVPVRVSLKDGCAAAKAALAGFESLNSQQPVRLDNS